MPHFGNIAPNFSVNNDRVLDNLRVRQPNTFKLPPATKNLIDPNVVNDDDKLVGDNNPVTNATLRSGVSQAGSLVYCTTPIINPLDDDPIDGCFDNRNHLYFSDGDQWIPLANCLPSSEPSSGGGDCCGGSFEISGGTEENPIPVKKEDSGKTGFISTESYYFLPDISGPDSNGLCYKFINKAMLSSETAIIYSSFPPQTSLFVGGWAATYAVPEDEFIIFVPNIGAHSVPGDWVEVYSYDGKWYVNMMSSQPEGVRFGPLIPP